ncbi:MAG: hypothetical protein V4850_06670 [Myxococcota bacterium]
MKTLLLLGAAAAFSLTGCDGGGKCDTGDTACGASGDVVVDAVSGTCAGTVCTWEVTTIGEMGVVEMDLAETGDSSGSCVSNPNCSPEGFWTEYHDEFELVDFTDTTETKAINLDLVDSFANQVQNQSTILDLNNGDISNNLTVLFTVTDSDNNYADCVAYGHNPEYFSDSCSNFW